MNKSLSLSLWNRHTSKRYFIYEKSRTQGEISEDEVADSTHHSSTNRMYEHRLSLSKVGHIKQHYVSSEIVHGQSSTVLEAHIIWHLVDKLSRDGYCFSPGIIITKTNHSVANLKWKSVIISKRKQNGSLSFYFIGLLSIGCEYNDLSHVKRQTSFCKLKADFIATVLYLYRFAWYPIPLLVSQHDIITEIVVLYLQANVFSMEKWFFLIKNKNTILPTYFFKCVA